MGVYMNIRKVGIMLALIATVSLSGCSNEKSAKSYYKDGVTYLKEANYEQARDNLKQATVKNPNRAQYCIDYGLALIKTGDFDMALKEFDKAIMNKDNLIVKQNNKSAYRGKGITYFEMASYDKAIKEFDLALEISELPELNMDILYYKGSSEEKAGKYEDAIKTYEAILNEQSKDGELYGKRANLYSYLGNYEKALTDYEKALSLEPNDYDLYFGKYFILMDKGDSQAANEVLTKAETLKTKKKDCYNLGKVSYFKGDLEQAKEFFKQAIEENQTSAYYYLGEISEQEKEYRLGIDNYEKYIVNETNIKSGMVYNQLGTCYLEEGDYQKALDTLQKGINLNDNLSKKALEYNEIVAYEFLIMFEQAYEKANIYVSKYPDDESMVKELEFIKSRITVIDQIEEGKNNDKENMGSNIVESDDKVDEIVQEDIDKEDVGRDVIIE